eukprot:TRINITY_DN104497_c0_g1_i1.p1 TRINITY_DN104497_c0_g1~~TRINITY_DN104497_c0_g1_i1.p1  ORF type:complete len:135 (-),score=14.15 TRINITY_DN104497_c0_g1_i1:308-670(-)
MHLPSSTVVGLRHVFSKPRGLCAPPPASDSAPSGGLFAVSAPCRLVGSKPFFDDSESDEENSNAAMVEGTRSKIVDEKTDVDASKECYAISNDVPEEIDVHDKRVIDVFSVMHSLPDPSC